jgi:hypothetical protein
MLTYDGTTLALYVNGTLDSSEVAKSGVCQTTEPLHVGHVSNSDFAPFNGSLDDVRIYPRAISADEVIALAQSGWQDATLTQSGGGTSLTNWTANPPLGLEGAYQIDLRGRDALGNVDTSNASRNVWGGQVDTLGPRVTYTQQTVGQGTDAKTLYTVEAEDFNLTTDGFQSICPTNAMEQEHIDAPWYLALTGQDTPGQLVGMEGSCYGDPSPTPPTLQVCDTFGNCTTAEPTALPPIEASHQIFLPLINVGNSR